MLNESVSLVSLHSGDTVSDCANSRRLTSEYYSGQRQKQRIGMLEAALEGATSNLSSAGQDFRLLNNITELCTASAGANLSPLRLPIDDAINSSSEEAWHESTADSQNVHLCDTQLSLPSWDWDSPGFMPLDTTGFSEFDNFEARHTTIPDDRVLDVPELECISTALVFAKLLHCDDTIWNPTASRTLDLPPSAVALLPANLQPTPTQRRITHHPLFDILPWPSVRARFICVFAQPPELRPPNARDEMAMMRLVYDLDDPAEGLRVSGADRVDTRNWEVGQQVFQNWWWVFDHEILATSNALRLKRGATRLRITPS